jgi:SulP family sulfate permease
VLTVVFDLVVAIAVGLILTAFLFMKKMADSASLRTWNADGDKKLPKHTVVFEIHGPMFFAATDKFLNFPRDDGTKVMIVRASDMTALDSTTVRNFENLLTECKKDGITLIFSHVHEDVLAVMKKAGLYEAIGKENFCENIDKALERAEEIVK